MTDSSSPSVAGAVHQIILKSFVGKPPTASNTSRHHLDVGSQYEVPLYLIRGEIEIAAAPDVRFFPNDRKGCAFGSSLSEIQDHRDVVRRLLPAAHVAADAGLLQVLLQVGRDPDVVEAAAAVVAGPVGRAVAPPGEQLLILRHEVAHGVDPFARGLDAGQLLDLDRRVADDVEQLLVRPHVVLQRRDVEIAHHDRALLVRAGS